MQQHVKILAILNIVYGGLLVLLGIVVFLVLGGVAGFVSQIDANVDVERVAPLLGLIGAVVGAVMMILSAPSIIAGIGLLSYRPWARILTIVLSAIHLLSIPFGTALGVYGLWVLLSAQTEPLFQQQSVQSQRYA